MVGSSECQQWVGSLNGHQMVGEAVPCANEVVGPGDLPQSSCRGVKGGGSQVGEEHRYVLMESGRSRASGAGRQEGRWVGGRAGWQAGRRASRQVEGKRLSVW